MCEHVSELRSKIQPFQALESRAADLDVLKELAAEESPDQQAGIIAEVTSEYESLLRDLEKFELQQFLSGEFDKNPAFLTIHAGAGGHGILRLGGDAPANVFALDRAERSSALRPSISRSATRPASNRPPCGSREITPTAI